MGAHVHTIRINFNHVVYPGEERVVDSIDYRPAVVRVQPGDEVRWISNYNLKVCFHKGTPFQRIQIETPAEVESAPEPVLRDAEKRGYHYNVHGALVVGGQLLFFGDPGCPEIIVE